MRVSTGAASFNEALGELRAVLPRYVVDSSSVDPLPGAEGLYELLAERYEYVGEVYLASPYRLRAE
ncbi:MAG: hypothetical protein O3C25_01115 [Chloroflexi bacterium]|nr:hypothetical protein [Chloroflexota bacterium]